MFGQMRGWQTVWLAVRVQVTSKVVEFLKAAMATAAGIWNGALGEGYSK